MTARTLRRNLELPTHITDAEIDAAYRSGRKFVVMMRKRHQGRGVDTEAFDTALLLALWSAARTWKRDAGASYLTYSMQTLRFRVWRIVEQGHGLGRRASFALAKARQEGREVPNHWLPTDYLEEIPIPADADGWANCVGATPDFADEVAQRLDIDTAMREFLPRQRRILRRILDGEGNPQAAAPEGLTRERARQLARKFARVMQEAEG